MTLPVLPSFRMNVPMPGAAHRKSFQGVLHAPDGDKLKLEYQELDANGNPIFDMEPGEEQYSRY